MGKLPQRLTIFLAVVAGCTGITLLTTGSPPAVAVGTVFLAAALVAARIDLRFTILGWLIPLLAGMLMSFVVDDIEVRSALLHAGSVAASVTAVAMLGKTVLAKAARIRMLFGKIDSRIRNRREVTKGAACSPNRGNERHATVEIFRRVMSTYSAIRVRGAFEGRRPKPISPTQVAGLVGTAMLVSAGVLAIPAFAATVAGASGATDRFATWQLGLGVLGLILLTPSSIGSSDGTEVQQSSDDYPPEVGA